MGDDVNLCPVDGQVVGHEVGVVVVECDEGIDVGGALTEDLPRGFVVWRGELFEEEVLAG